MGGVFGIGGSSSGTDRTNQLSSWGDLQSLFNFASPTGQSSVGTGTSNLGTAGNFFSGLLSGNPSTTATLLGPQIGTLTTQAGQQKATNAEFGNRSGGTNAANQEIDVNTRANIDNLISTLTGASATGLESVGAAQAGVGEGLLSLAESSAGTKGSQATGARSTDLAQNNLLGSSIGSLLSNLPDEIISLLPSFGV